MTTEHTRPPLATLAETIRQDVAPADLGLTEQALTRLSQNIARAILLAIEAHVEERHRPEPEYGELERNG